MGVISFMFWPFIFSVLNLETPRKLKDNFHILTVFKSKFSHMQPSSKLSIYCCNLDGNKIAAHTDVCSSTASLTTVHLTCWSHTVVELIDISLNPDLGLDWQYPTQLGALWVIVWNSKRCRRQRERKQKQGCRAGYRYQLPCSITIQWFKFTWSIPKPMLVRFNT